MPEEPEKIDRVELQPDPGDFAGRLVNLVIEDFLKELVETAEFLFRIILIHFEIFDTPD